MEPDSVVAHGPPAARLLFVVALAACGWGDLDPRRPGPVELDHTAFQPVLLQGDILPRSETIALPWRLEVSEGHLVVIDLGSDPVVQLRDKRDGALIQSFGRKGEGPGELTRAWSIDPVAGPAGEVWIYDVSRGRINCLRVDGEPAERGDSTAESIRLLAGTTVLDPIGAGSLFVALGFFERGRLGVFDANGNLLRTIGESPPGDSAVPAHLRQHAYQSSLTANPSRTRFAVATRHADLLEIYSLDDELIARADPPFGFLPEYTISEGRGEPRLATDRNLRFGYIDVTATETRIYALFSGRTRRGFPGEANFGEYVHVYDWRGSLVEVYQLEDPAIALGISHDRTDELYALRHHPTPAIVLYRLPA